jgi:hypothetical protein
LECAQASITPFSAERSGGWNIRQLLPGRGGFHGFPPVAQRVIVTRATDDADAVLLSESADAVAVEESRPKLN